MTARHFVLWTSGDRTHIASRNAYRKGEARWRHDETNTVPEELVDALGGWEWQTPINGPFPAFSADRLPAIVEWLIENGYTARVIADPESGGGQGSRPASTSPDPARAHPREGQAGATGPPHEPTTNVMHAGPELGAATLSREHSIILLTGVTPDGEQLVVIPLGIAVAELRSYAGLLGASTFGEAREDPANAQLVDEHAPVYVERLLEQGLVDKQMDDTERLVEHTWSGASFDAEDFFGSEDSAYWRPDPHLSTSEWLAACEPDLFATFMRPDTGWGWVAAVDRDALERGLTALGYVVQHVDGLHELYLDPPLNIRELLPGDEPA